MARRTFVRRVLFMSCLPFLHFLSSFFSIVRVCVKILEKEKYVTFLSIANLAQSSTLPPSKRMGFKPLQYP